MQMIIYESIFLWIRSTEIYLGKDVLENCQCRDNLRKKLAGSASADWTRLSDKIPTNYAEWRAVQIPGVKYWINTLQFPLPPP